MIRNFDTIQHDPGNTAYILIDDFDLWGFEAICTFIWWRIVFLLPDDKKKKTNKQNQQTNKTKQANKQTKTKITHPPNALKCYQNHNYTNVHFIYAILQLLDCNCRNCLGLHI